MTRAWIGLGSNQGDSARVLSRALADIDLLPATSLIDVSPVYLTPPWGVTEQDDFLNAVAEVESGLSPQALLRALLGVEAMAGRRRDGQRWGPRTLDLDLLVFGESMIETEALQIPHPRLHERAFVLVPLNDIAPKLVVPGRGAVADLLAALDESSRADIQLHGSLEYHRGP